MPPILSRPARRPTAGQYHHLVFSKSGNLFGGEILGVSCVTDGSNGDPRSSPAPRKHRRPTTEVPGHAFLDESLGWGLPPPRSHPAAASRCILSADLQLSSRDRWGPPKARLRSVREGNRIPDVVCLAVSRVDCPTSLTALLSES